MLNHLKKIGGQTVIYGVGVFLTKAIGFLMIPLYTHYLSPDEYGRLELIELTSFALAFFVGLGANAAVLRVYHLHPEGPQRDSVISTALWLTILSGLVLVACTLPFVAEISSFVLEASEFAGLFALVCVTLVFGTALELAYSILRARQESTLFTALTLGGTVAALSLNVYFVAVAQIGILGILLSTLVCQSVVSSFLAYKLFRNFGARFNFEILRELLRYGLPFVPTGMFSFVLMWSDRFFIQRLADMEQVGLYALGNKFAMILVFLIATPFGLVWGTYTHEIRNALGADRVYSRVGTYFFFCSVFVALAISVFASEMVHLLAATEYSGVVNVIPILVLGFLFMTADQIFLIGMLIEGKSEFMLVCRGSAAVTNIFLNIVLIPSYGMLGAAWATAFSWALYIVLVYLLSQKVHPINFEFRRLAPIGAWAGVLYAVCGMLSGDSMVLNVIIKGALLMCFPLVLLAPKFLVDDERQFLLHLGSTVLRQVRK